MKTTNKKPKAQYIQDRVDKINNKSFDDVIGMKYFNGAIFKKYTEGDWRYDIKCGYLEYANSSIGYEVKIPSRVHVNEHEHELAQREANGMHDRCMLM